MSKKKNKKALWKRILKWTGITFLLLIILIALVPYFFKDQIIALIKEEANASLNATLDFKDADLTIFSNFPNLTLTVDEVSIIGKGEFENVPLTEIKQLSLKLDLWSVLTGDQFQIDAIHLVEPKINIQVLPNGKANYDIAIVDTTAVEEVSEEPASAFKFALEEYTITDGDITYNDKPSLTYLHLEHFNHTGKISIDDIHYVIETVTEETGVTMVYDKVAYFDESIFAMNCDLGINMPEDEMTISFKENEVVLNKLKLHFDGDMLMKDDFMDFDFTFNTIDQTFKSLLSVVPGAYSSSFDDIKTDGNIEFKGSLNGKYSETDMPGFDLTTKINNAWLQYPDLPSKLEDISMDLNIKRAAGPDLDNLIVDLKSLGLQFLENKIDASLYLTHPMTDPNIKSHITSYLDLAELGKVIPMEEGESYTGIINADIALEGKLSSIEQEKYDEFKAEGDLVISDMDYKTASLPYDVKIDSMHFAFTPASLRLNAFESRVGASDFSANGNIQNYMAYALKGDTLQGQFLVSSNLMNVDELMGTEEVVETSSENTQVVAYDSSAAEVFVIPGNVNFTLNTLVKEMIYDSLSMYNLAGSVGLKNGVATMKDISIEVLEGTIGMNGSYEALSPKRALVDFDYDINDLSFKESFKYFNSVEKYMPIAKYCEGKFSTKLNLKAKVDEFYSPIYSTVTGLGDFTSNSVKISDAPVFEKISKLIKLDKFKNQTIQNMDMSFEFKDGKIWLEESPIKLGGYNSTISGTTSFDQDIEYKVKTEIPKEAFGSKANEVLSGLLGKVEDATGQDINIPDNIPLTINIMGNIMDPQIKTNLKGAGDEVKQNLVDQGKEILKDKFGEEAAKLLADAQEQADKLIAEAKVQSDKLRAETESAALKIEEEAVKAREDASKEADKAAEELKQEGYKNADKLVEEAKNPLAKLAAQKAAEKLKLKTDEQVEALKEKSLLQADKLKETADAQADKTREEGNAKADLVDSTAQKEADKILETAQNKVDKITE